MGILLVIFLLINFLTKIHIHTILFITFYVLYIIYVNVLYMVTNKRSKELEIAGEITITTSALIKTIKETEERFDFKMITKFKTEIFLRKLIFPTNYDSSQAYLVSIEYEGKAVDPILISSQSEDKPETNFLDVIKSTEKRLSINLLRRQRNSRN
jgi:Ca2+/Na+ antiporter